MNAIHADDRIYALEGAVSVAQRNNAEVRVLPDLREMLAKARKDAR